MSDQNLPVPITAPMTLTSAIGDAMAEQAKAEIQARYQLALHNPRDINTVRTMLLKACQRPRFAKIAIYRKPIGNTAVEGPSIRFVEEALRCFRNVFPQVSVIHEDARIRIIRTAVTDVESNLTYSQDILIEKTVERSDARGRTIIGQRLNTQGKTVYIVQATEDDLIVKQASLISKTTRTLGLRILPGDIVDDALEEIRTTRSAGEAAQDPDAPRKQMCDSWAQLGVLPSALAEYLGHDLSTITQAEMGELYGLEVAIREGQTTWHEIMAERIAAREEDRPEPAELKSENRGAALGVKTQKQEQDPNAPPLLSPEQQIATWSAALQGAKTKKEADVVCASFADADRAGHIHAETKKEMAKVRGEVYARWGK